MAQNDVGIYASQISGHLWAPNGAYDALATTTVGSGGVSSVTFAGIPQGYKHLQVRVSNTNGGTIRFNGDTTTSNYRYHVIFGDGSTAGGGTGASAAYFPVSGSTSRTAEIMDILDYSSLSKYKTLKIIGGWDNNGTGEAYLASNLWMKTEAITSMTMTGTFPQYASFALYGVK